MAQTIKHHLEACPSLKPGSTEACTCHKEHEHYIGLAIPVMLVSTLLFIGGALTGSGALYSEAVHQIFDSMESLTNAAVSRVARKGNEKFARWVGVKIGALLLIVASVVFIIPEGWEKIQNPQPVSPWMILFAFAGFRFTLWLRKKHHGAKKEHHNVNHRLQDWHFLADLGIDGSVIIGGTAMWILNGYYSIDGYLMMAIGGIVGLLGVLRIIGIELHSHAHDEGSPTHEHKHGEQCNRHH